MFRRISIFLSACALLACGDDGGESTPTSDVGTDTPIADVGVDAATDTPAPDAPGADTPAADPPEIDDVRPARGPLEGRQSVAILGDNFVGR